MQKRRGPDKRRRVVSALRASVVREGARAARGRPRAEIDWPTVEMLLSIGATDEEVAAGVGVSTDTLHREPHASIFAESIDLIRGRAKLSIRQAVWALAFGRRVHARDAGGTPMFDKAGRPLMTMLMASEKVQLEALRFLAKQREYLGWTERADVTTMGSVLPPGVAPGVLTIVVDDTTDERHVLKTRGGDVQP